VPVNQGNFIAVGALGGFVGAAPGGAPAWGPNTESGLLIWLDADDAGTITAPGGNLSAWANKGSIGGNVNATNTTTVAAGRNGRNIVRTLQASNSQMQHASAVVNETSLTILAAIADTDSDDTDTVHMVIDMQEQSGGFNGPNLATYNSYAGHAGQRRVFPGANGGTVTPYKNDVASPVTLALNEWAVCTATYSAISALSGAGIPFTVGINSALGLPASFDIGEILVYQGAKSAGVLTQATNYLKTRWGIA